MDSYLDINRRAYDSMANEYQRRVSLYVEKDKVILRPFVDYLKASFQDQIRVLDIGPGSGLNLAMLVAEGFFTVGVDISSNMLSVARDQCPSAVLIRADFLQVEFHSESFEGILARSSLHLFPKKDALSAFARINTALRNKGALFIATTVSEIAEEGYYEKTEFGIPVVRYRKFWTRNELLEGLSASGFRIHNEAYDVDNTGTTTWINLLAVK